jgi:AcrR family transcriptional regulator
MYRSVNNAYLVRKVSMKSGKLVRGPGRPRSFDKAKALDRAMHVFWKVGYEAASMSDLTRAMGINRPSLYAAFGDKEALFFKVMDRYGELSFASIGFGSDAPTARAYVEGVLRGAADWHTAPDTPPGCLMVVGALASGAKSAAIRAEMKKRRAADEAVVWKRLEQAKTSGELPQDANPADLARFVMTVIRGMVVAAVGGASRDELEGVIRTAMRAWPDMSKTNRSRRTRRVAH